MRLVLALFILAVSHSSYAENFVQALKRPGPSQNLTIPRIFGTQEKKEPPIVTAVGKLLAQRLQQMRDRKERYGSANFSIGDRWTYSCAETCACLTRRFAETLKANNIPHRTLVIHNGKDFRVQIRSNSGALATYDYHEVTLLMLAGRWRVVDPITIGSTKAEPLADWVKRIENPYLKSVEIASY